ncbi:hypothetical protein [Streptomyces coeruleorubidus]|uniref:hypothetical protein n=1 Tax=Streptomyces coeruleorubidus TaxID=116188 RepID=UPI003679AC94
MGFGKSETPQDRTYDASEHILNLESLLVDTLDLTDITLVLRDWGGPSAPGSRCVTPTGSPGSSPPTPCCLSQTTSPLS